MAASRQPVDRTQASSICNPRANLGSTRPCRNVGVRLGLGLAHGEAPTLGREGAALSRITLHDKSCQLNYDITASTNPLHLRQELIQSRDPGTLGGGYL
jgi:hypothetical protein